MLQVSSVDAFVESFYFTAMFDKSSSRPPIIPPFPETWAVNTLRLRLVAISSVRPLIFLSSICLDRDRRRHRTLLCPRLPFFSESVDVLIETSSSLEIYQPLASTVLFLSFGESAGPT